MRSLAEGALRILHGEPAKVYDAKRSDTVYVSLLYVLYYAAANAAKKNHEKIPGVPKACRVSASYCICSQLMRARFAG